MTTPTPPTGSAAIPIIPLARLLARRPGGNRFDGLSGKDSAILMAWDTYVTANAMLTWAAQGVQFDIHDLAQAALTREIGLVMLGTSALPKGV